MAKIRVEQIKDLGISTINGTSTIQIGTGAENSIVPLTSVSTVIDGAESGYISGVTHEGNVIKLTRTALPGITVNANQTLPEGAVPFVRDIAASGHTITKTMGAIGNGLAINADGVLNLNLAVTPANGSAGQVISGLSYANGVLAPTYSTVAAANVTIADAGGKFTAENVEGALAELAGSIAAIDPVVTTVVEGTGIKVTDAGTGNDHAYTVAADFTVDTIKYGSDAGNKANKTYIRIMDGTTVISETDAAAFVQDGFLQEVKLIEASEGQENVLRFIWNSDAGEQVTDIKVSDLCDVYTVGEGLVASEDGFTFSHQAGATGLTTNTVFGSGSATANEITVKVPSVTVDKFGHVSALSETEVSLEIPASVASAVQTVTGDTYVSATKDGTEVTLATKIKAVADATADADGLATAHSVKSYVDGKIEALDTPTEGVSSAATNNVKVTVKQVDGIVNSVEVVDNSINATDLQTAIEALDADKSGSNTNNDITVQVVEADGKITAVNVSDTLKSVAHTGAAADVKLSEGVSVIAATDVEGALVEIATEIDNMDLIATDVVALSADGLSLKAGKISETDGKVAIGDAATLVEFSQATSSDNKVATMADVTAAQNNATVVGEKAIDVVAATGEGATGKVVKLNIDTADKVLTQSGAGLLANISLTYDTDAKEIKLLGKNDENATPVVISTIDADDFVKDGMLQSAELVETAEEGVTTEVPYLKFTWNADSSIQITRISVKKFIDTYTSGDSKTLTVSGYTIKPVTATVAANATGLAVAGDVHAKIAATKGQDIQSITGETATTQGDYINVKVTATEDDNHDYTLSTTSNVTTQAVSTATATANGLATAYDVKGYVDSKVAGATEEATETLEFSKVVKGTRNNAGAVELNPGTGYTVEAGSVCVYINGQLIPDTGYSVNGNTVTVNANQYVASDVAFTLEATDRIDVVAHATKTVTLTYLKLKTAQNA